MALNFLGSCLQHIHARFVFWDGNSKVIRALGVNPFGSFKVLLIPAILLCCTSSTNAFIKTEGGTSSLLQNFLQEEFSDSLNQLITTAARAKKLADLMDSNGGTSANRLLHELLDGLVSQAPSTPSQSGESTTPRYHKTTDETFETSTHSTCPYQGMSKEEAERRLWEGIKSGSSPEIEEAAGCGADLGSRNAEELTPLIQAVVDGNEGPVETLLRLGAGTEGTGGNAHQTALHFAAARGRNSALKALLSAGANVGAEDAFGRTPLHWAAWYGHLTAARSLVRAGAEVNPRDSSGQTPLGIAIAFAQHDVQSYLISVGGQQ